MRTHHVICTHDNVYLWLSSTRGGPVYSSHNYKARRFYKGEAERLAALEKKRTGLHCWAACIN